MTQIVVQHFELDRIPQAAPRATKDAVHELPPQRAKGGGHPLTHRAENEAVGGRLVSHHQLHISLGCQL